MTLQRSISIGTICLAAAFFLAPVSAVSAQESEEAERPPLPAGFDEPMPLYTTALGPFTRTISSTNEEAQAYFNQGFQLMYAFAKNEAIHSFREATRKDPNCAICYWGEAWTWGSYLNGPMRLDEAPHAYAAILRALELADEHASQKERDFIHALAVRYVEHFDPDKRVEQDKAYADAMQELYARYPDDVDVGTLYAEALFLLEPRRGTRDLNDPDVQRLHGVLETVLATDIRHPGACHLYVHATESTIEPEKAEACTEFLGNSIPGASHINHMPSHTWNEIGRWGDSVRANTQAWHSDQKAEIGDGIAIYPPHNLHMLLFAASMDGQGAVAIQAAKDYAKVNGDSVFHVLTLLRFGRFDEIRTVTDRPENEATAGLWDFAQGYAHLRDGEVDFARAYLKRVQAAAASSEARFRFHTAKEILSIVGDILEGEISRETGDLPAAISSFERAVTLEDALDYAEPEVLPFAARQWLGAVLIEAERYEDAARVYREELEDHPHNGWSLLGLQQALAAQGVSSPDVDEDLAASWARADTWITASRF